MPRHYVPRNEDLRHPELDSTSHSREKCAIAGQARNDEKAHAEFISASQTTPLTPSPQTGRWKCAFTLAEVLITLGIIGVVAALTLPAIVAHYKDKVFESKLKKAKSALGNAFKMMFAKNNVEKISDLPISNCNVVAGCYANEIKTAMRVGRDNVSGGLQKSSLPDVYSFDKTIDIGFSWNDVLYIMQTADGISYGFKESEPDKNKYRDGKPNGVTVYVDLNGSQKPNKLKQDFYKLYISSEGIVTDISDDFLSCSKNDAAACNQEQCMALGYKPYSSNGSVGFNRDGLCILYLWMDNRCTTWPESYCR